MSDAPRIVYGLKSLAAELGTTPHVIKSMRADGAPIARRRHARGARYFAVWDRLLAWLEAQP